MVVLVTIAVVALIATLLAVRYVPYLGQAQDTLAVATNLSQRMRGLRIQDVDRPTLTVVRSDLHKLDERLTPFRDLLRADPLVGLLGGLPIVEPLYVPVRVSARVGRGSCGIVTRNQYGIRRVWSPRWSTTYPASSAAVRATSANAIRSSPYSAV